MDSDALIELALKKLGCTQQTLAKRLGVSPTQVSKWKGNGTEHMSSEMEKKLKALAGLDE
jgi:transcriptional regulator with XRE-family HTH domain